MFGVRTMVCLFWCAGHAGAAGAFPSVWKPAASAPTFVLPLANKPGRPVAVFERGAAAVTAVSLAPATIAGTASGGGTNYVIDYGLEMQGGACASEIPRHNAASSPQAVLSGVKIACIASCADTHRFCDVHHRTLHAAGVNLSFTGVTAGHMVTILLSEELKPDGTPLVPMHTGNNFTSVWTLASDGVFACLCARPCERVRVRVRVCTYGMYDRMTFHT